MRNSVACTPELDKVSHEATHTYGNRWATGTPTNRLYIQATSGRTVRYANDLIDEALALCGDPYYSTNQRRWGKHARAFLALFQVAQ